MLLRKGLLVPIRVRRRRESYHNTWIPPWKGSSKIYAVDAWAKLTWVSLVQLP